MLTILIEAASNIIITFTRYFTALTRKLFFNPGNPACFLIVI